MVVSCEVRLAVQRVTSAYLELSAVFGAPCCSAPTNTCVTLNAPVLAAVPVFVPSRMEQFVPSKMEDNKTSVFNDPEIEVRSALPRKITHLDPEVWASAMPWLAPR